MLWNPVKLLVIGLILVVGCSPSTGSGGGDDGDGGGNGGEKEPTTYTLTVEVNPDGSGSVNPSSGTFEEGTEITVRAKPNKGWEFERWTGDIQSADNPLIFTINQNTQLMANFLDITSEYTTELTVQDSLDAVHLVIGQITNATGSFDRNVDEQAPPPPPEGSFFSYLSNQGERLFKDYRNSTSKEEIWPLIYTVGSGNSLDISWDIDQKKMAGTLMLTDTENSFEIDMLQQQSYQVSPTDTDTLYIHYLLGTQ